MVWPHYTLIESTRGDQMGLANSKWRSHRGCILGKMFKRSILINLKKTSMHIAQNTTEVTKQHFPGKLKVEEDFINFSIPG